jgi:uncharacterized protein (TIGR02996 family)
MPKHFHPEELALLAAIHAEPRDDTPRLVYADWLQEHGQEEYAEFIRLQCIPPKPTRILSRRELRAEAMEDQREERPTDPDTLLSLRLQELEFGYGKFWASPIPRRMNLVHFFRGLPVARVTLKGDQPSNLDSLLRRMSPRLRLNATLFVSSELPLDHPVFSRVNEIIFLGDSNDSGYLRDSHIRQVASCPYLARFLSVSLFAVFPKFKDLSDELIGKQVTKLRYVAGSGAS